MRKKTVNMSEAQACDIIIAPMVTEKSTTVVSQGHYVFKVSSDADKVKIKQAIETLYKGVKVEKVNTLRVKGKTKTFKGRVGYRKSFKKAIVKLPEGQTINLDSGK